MKKKPILIFSEGISYCHIIRPLIIGTWLRELNIPILVACTPKVAPLFHQYGFKTTLINTADPVAIYKRLAKGKWIYEVDDLLKYFDEDEKLIKSVQPELIVADFRFTALQLAKKMGIPSVGITSASCHPHFRLEGSVPDSFQVFKKIEATWLGRLIRHMIINRISSRYKSASRQAGMEALPSFFHYASQGDVCVLADHPDIMPITHKRPQDIYAGPLIWNREDPLPPELSRLKPHKKKIYLTIGTQESLDIKFLTELLPALLKKGFQIILSKGKRNIDIPTNDKNLFVFDFVNESKILPLVDLYLYHGSAMSTYNGLYHGVPMIAIPSQVDQHFHAEALPRNKVGRYYVPSRLHIDTVVRACVFLSTDSITQAHCRLIQKKLQMFNGRGVVMNRIRKLMGLRKVSDIPSPLGAYQLGDESHE